MCACKCSSAPHQMLEYQAPCSHPTCKLLHYLLCIHGVLRLQGQAVGGPMSPAIARSHSASAWAGFRVQTDGDVPGQAIAIFLNP